MKITIRLSLSKTPLPPLLPPPPLKEIVIDLSAINLVKPKEPLPHA